MTQAVFEIRIQDLVTLALRRRASDIHFAPGVRAAIRVDGALEYVDGPIVSSAETAGFVDRAFDERSRCRLEQVGDATVTVGRPEGVRLRIHALKSSTGIALAIRVLPQDVPTLESLQLPRVVGKFAEKSCGLVIFAGPTGSGKSTSLAAVLGAINARQPRRVITIEDPIEYRHESARAVVAQREVGSDVPSFARAVIESLRADPDVIAIGEMREPATMRAAMNAAETGHLVLTTLHAGGAVQAVDRIVDAFESEERASVRAQLSSTLVAIVAQRLLPRATGSGRAVAAEILVATDAVRATIRDARIHQLRNLIVTGRESGMQTLEHHISELVAQRYVDRAIAEPFSVRNGDLHEVAGGTAG